VRHRLLIVLGLPALLAGIAATAQPAGAAPTDRKGLERQLDKQNEEADQVVEAYLQKKLALDTARRSADGLRTRMRSTEVERARLQVQVDRIGAGVYMQGPGAGMIAVFDTKDPARAIQGMEALTVLSRRTDDLLAQYKTVDQSLEALAAELGQTEKTLRTELAKLGDEKSKVEGAVSRTEDLLRRLSAREQARRGVPGVYSGPLPPVSGRAGVAVSFALAQVGKPYQWGADGPGSYDCSGLTMSAWAAAGVSLPHSSSAQLGAGRVIPMSARQPGDLIYRPGHITMYIGNGKQVAATHTGDFVRVQDAQAGTYVRVVG
jgi:peptidoglycan DL-endopeptidase CwlO